MREYLASFGIPKLKGQVDFYLHWDIVPVIARVRGKSVEAARETFDAIGHSGSEGKIGDNSVVIFKDASIIAGKGTGWKGVAHSAAHSTSHSYQNLLSSVEEQATGFSEVYSKGPVWLVEGGAEFQTIRALAKGFVYSYDRRREWYRERASSVDFPLSELETFETVLAIDNGYAPGTMAVELLAFLTGEEAVIAYWTLLRNGTTWQEAFEAAFGMTTAEFYPLYEKHRAKGYPALDLPSILPPLDEVSQEDRPALVALLNATGGPSWENNSNWLSNAHIVRWHGVTINSSGRVTELHLPRNGLSGNLPPELGNLTELRILTLWANDLTGALPPEMTNLTRLEDLSVGGNRLSGGIPSWLGNLSNLTELHLVSNRFSGQIPPEIGDLPLRWLFLKHNRLSGDIPAELGNLSGLQSISLQGNNLTGCIPAGLQDVPDNDFAEAGLPFCGQ